MNLLTKKILEYQKKKLLEAKENLKTHKHRKIKLDAMDSGQFFNEIQQEEKMIAIWEKNIKKIKNEIQKLQKL